MVLDFLICWNKEAMPYSTRTSKPTSQSPSIISFFSFIHFWNERERERCVVRQYESENKLATDQTYHSHVENTNHTKGSFRGSANSVCMSTELKRKLSYSYCCIHRYKQFQEHLYCINSCFTLCCFVVHSFSFFKSLIKKSLKSCLEISCIPVSSEGAFIRKLSKGWRSKETSIFIRGSMGMQSCPM